MAILVVAAHDNKAVRANVANAVVAAGQMGPDVTVLVAGKDCGEAAKSAAAIAGVARVLQAEDAAYANWVAEDIAPLVVKLAPGYSHVIATATTFGKNLMPRVAALLDVQQISEVIGIEAADTFVRPVLAGNAYSKVQVGTPIVVVTPRQSEFEPAAELGTAGSRRATTSRSSRRWPTSWERRWVLRAPRWIRATARTTTRSGRPARSSLPSSTSRSVFRAPSSTSRA